MAQNTNRRATNDRIIWIDCEMTGLSLTTDALIEVAALVTDYELNQLGDGIDLVIKPPAEALNQMDDFVREMHTSSGLLKELAAGITMQVLISAAASTRATFTFALRLSAGISKMIGSGISMVSKTFDCSRPFASKVR